MLKHKKLIAVICSLTLFAGMLPLAATAEGSPSTSETGISTENLENETYIIWYESIPASTLMDEAQQKANEYEASLDKTVYTYTEIEKLKTDYYKAVLRELTSNAYTAHAEKILAELGVDNAKASYSRYAPMIICELNEEQLIAAEVREDITSISLYEPLESPEDVTEIEPTTTDGASILPGDANGDFTVSLADAVAVLQYIANSDIYTLSEQEKINADCYNPGSGITGLDAASIQMYDAKTISSLPVISD